jgi:toxin ParE1/3/4
MSVRILRRPKAVQDAESIADYIAGTSLDAAVRFLESTELTLAELAESPGLGSRFESTIPDLTGLRYRRVRGFPNHFLFFIEHDDAIEVLRILHGARDLDTELRNT